MTTTTLHVQAAKTETSPGEFVTDGFQVAFNGEPIYQSSSPLKAAIKAIVLLEDERFAEATGVSFEDGLAGLVGTANLSQRIDAERFMAMRQVAMAEVPVDAIVGAIKGNGNNVKPVDPEA